MPQSTVIFTIALILTPTIANAIYHPACPPVRDDALNIHLIAHSHDDVGWVKTVDQYYNKQVRFILDTVVDQLLLNETYRFSYTEMAFFHKWWMDQTDERKSKVRELVAAGRLQFALGGWVSADEAVVHYSDLIDQLTRGRNLIHDLFDCPKELPKVAWQVDTFGHSREHGRIFSEAAYEALYFQRMNFREKQRRQESRELQLLWKTEANGRQSNQQLFTSIFYYGYCFPWDVCLQTSCGFDPVNQNVSNDTVSHFLMHIKEWMRAYRTNHILVPMGCDFAFTQANLTYKAIDSLIANLHGRTVGNKSLHVFYSTPSCYTRALNEAWPRNEQLPERDGDFFPYADKANAFWTGFYTSRPSLKAYARQTSLLLAMVEQLNVFVGSPQDTTIIDNLRQQVAVLQHHDALTGTEKLHVAQDYTAHLYGDAEPVHQLAANYINWLSGRQDGAQLQFCDLRNISICDAADSFTVGQVLPIVVYNPLAWEITQSLWIRIPIYVPPIQQTPRVQIATVIKEGHAPDTIDVPIQLVQVTSRTEQIPERRGLAGSSANMEILFNPLQSKLSLPAIGYRAFEIRLTSEEAISESKVEVFDSLVDEIAKRAWPVIYSLEHDAQSAYIVATHNETGRQIRIRVELLYYIGENQGLPNSGAYIFRPKGEAQAFPKPVISEHHGICVQEIAVAYTNYADLVLRRYVDNLIEVEWTVGPIADDNGTVSREIIVRYTMEPSSNWTDTEYFYTDSAGRRIMQRARKSAECGTKDKDDRFGIASNYYPVVNRIMLKEREGLDGSLPMAFAVYTDRAEGGSSLKPGQMELMLHRRLVKDDYLGVEEPLMENGADGKGLIVRGVHRLHVEELASFETTERNRAIRNTRQPVVLFGTPSTSNTSPYSQWSGLRTALPNHIHLLSLISWPLVQTAETKRQILIRLENLIARSELQQPEQLDVTELFPGIQVTNATEMIITADETKTEADAQRLRWPGQDWVTDTEQSVNGSEPRATDRVVLSLLPDRIYTFILDFKML